MNGSKLLVDPLAVFFRSELQGCPPLALDCVHVEVTLLPPLAQVTVARRFTNRSDRLIEAVLTLPPLGANEVVYRLIVSIDGIDYDAVPRPARIGRTEHDSAVGQGRRAILFELLRHDIPLISIAGIDPGATVEVQMWSIKPLGRPEEGRAVLSIPLSARHDAIMSGLADADALETTPEWHPAKLTVQGDGFHLTLVGQGAPFELLAEGPTRIDCAAPIQLQIVPNLGSTLDHSSVLVDEAGGWEVTSSRGTETFRHPLNPEGTVVSDRSDWIFGVMETAQSAIRVTAPLPSDGIGPNGRALRAFAAAAFAESATPQDPDAVRRTANILSRQSSLSFIGPEGELSGEIPSMRKLALPEMLAPERTGVPPQPVGLEPFDYGAPAALPEPLLPEKVEDRTTPGARPPRYSLLPWIIAAVGLLLLVGIFEMMAVGLPPRVLALLILLTLGALAALPDGDLPVRRRLPLLIVFVLPWIAALVSGPLLDDFTYGGVPPPDWMIPTQLSLLAASAILPLASLPFLRGARYFTIALGTFNFVLTAFVTLSAIIVLTPD